MAPVNKGLNDAEKKLVDFINAGKTAEAQLMVGDPDVNVNCLDENGMSPLQHASYKGNQQMVDYLICHGADVNSNDHDSGYTALMFAALSGNLGCVRSLLEAGAKTYPTNSVGRNAAQMAGFVGQHQVVSLINNFFSKEDLDYYTVPQGLEKEPKLPPELSPSLYKLILSNNLNPVKIVRYLQENPRLLEGENGKRIERVLDRLVEKMMKSHDTNEVMAMKFHYLLSIIKRCADNLKQSPQDNLNTLIRNLLRTNERGAHANQDHFVRSVLRTFPYAESQLLQQMVVQLAKTPVGGDPSSLGILNSGINGNRFASDDDNQCTTCAEFKAEKKCGACKMVRYCNQWCQKAHWFIHKKECKLLAEEFKRRQEEIKAQEEKDRKKKEEEEEKEKGDASKEETNGQTDESHNTSGDTDTLSQKLEKTQVQGEHDGQIEGTNKEGEKSRGDGQESRPENRSPTDGVVAAGSDVKKASWGKNKGKRGRKGKKKAVNCTAGVVPGCEKNRAECRMEEKNRAEDRTGDSKVENVEVDDIQVDLGGENVHIVDDVTDLKAQVDAEKGGITKGTTETEGERATGGKKCPFSGVTSGCGGLIPDRVREQDSVDSTDSFDEKVEKGQVLPPGHPPVDIASLAPVGANTAPKKPMLDIRMFCPKFASDDGGNAGDRKDIYDDLGEPIDMDDFVKGFQEFLNKKKALEKKIRRVDDDSDEESD